MRLEKILRNRIGRIVFAASLVLLGAWAFLPYVFHRVSASAFVNSELTRITAPFAGELSKDAPRPGYWASRPTSLPLVSSIAPNRQHLADLQKQFALATDNATLIEKQLNEISLADQELKQRTDDFRNGMIERLKLEIAEAENERTGCLAEEKQRRDVGARMEELTRLGHASEIRTSEANAAIEVATARCDLAKSRIEKSRAELESAQRGVYLRTQNDVPYSQQQRDRLFLRRQELELQQVQEKSRLSQVGAEIDAEKMRLQRVEQFDITIPASHVVWSTTASPGTMVTEGQTILDLANCAHRFVAVELPERDFEKVKIGSRASVRLVGSTEWDDGMVENIRGSAANADNRLFAATVKAATPGDITVEVSIPAGTKQDERNFCGIGRLAEVRFPRQQFWLVAKLGDAYSWLTRNATEKTALRVNPQQ